MKECYNKVSVFRLLKKVREITDLLLFHRKFSISRTNRFEMMCLEDGNYGNYGNVTSFSVASVKKYRFP